MKAYRKNPVGAHHGLGDWLLQRLTAVVMALYTIMMFVSLLELAPHTHEQWKMIFSGNFLRVATMLFVVSLLYHAWVGMRDILMDYLKSMGLRLATQSVVGFVLAFYVVWAASILWGQ